MQTSPTDLTNQQLLLALTEQLDVITDVMATKDDLKDFITKKDAEAFATKDDMHQMETRLSRKLDSHKTANIQHHLATRKMIGDLNRQYGELR